VETERLVNLVIRGNMVEHVAGIETGVEENTPMLDLCRKNQV